jgi:hypothetical protein
VWYLLSRDLALLTGSISGRTFSIKVSWYPLVPAARCGTCRPFVVAVLVTGLELKWCIRYIY